MINNIFVVFGDRVFQQSVGIPMGTNCAPLLADLFLYLYEADCIQKLLHEKEKSLAVAFNSTFRYINDVLSINNYQFHFYVDSIYPSELEIKDTTESATFASYLDILLKIDTDGKLRTQLYDKRDVFFVFLFFSKNFISFDTCIVSINSEERERERERERVAVTYSHNQKNN